MKRLATYLTKSEVQALLRQPDRRKLQGSRDWCILKLMLLTGLRRSEVCSISRGNFKLEDKKFWLYVIGKGSKERKIPLSDRDLLESLPKYWKRAGIPAEPSAPAFVTLRVTQARPARRITPRVIQKIVAKYAKQASISKNVHPHTLRHTALTHLLRKSGDLVGVKAIAGHSSISSTQIYLHTSEKQMEKIIAGFDYSS